MKAPKILPWIARKAGISDVLALKLWQRAVSESAIPGMKTPDSAFHARCVERFLDLVEETAGTAFRINYSNRPEKLSWYWRHQGRMALYGLAAAENAAKFWQDTWDGLVKSGTASRG